MDDRKIAVNFYEHEKTGLIVAVSDDMKGLFVHGKSFEEIEARIPIAMRAIIEAEQELAEEKKAKAPSIAGFRPVGKKREFTLPVAA